MTSKELYHFFGLQHYQTRETLYEGDDVIYVLEYTRRLRCSACGKADVIRHGATCRDFRTVPIGDKPVTIRYDVPRVECRKCGTIRQVRLKFARSYSRYTHEFEHYVLSLLQCATIKDVAALVKVSWDVVKEIAKRNLRRRYRRPRLKGVRRIAIDEIAVGKGHRYLSIVLDLERGVVLFVGKGKGSQALTPFWKRVYQCKQCKIQAVAIDMSPAYIQAVSQNLPQARIVFDRFHLVQLCNRMLTQLRRALYREALGPLGKDVLKGTRWLLLKNPENLDASKNEGARLQEALQLNAPLAMAYYMKDELRQLWQKPNKEQAERFLLDWLGRAQASGIQHLKRFAHTLSAHRSGILAWYDDPISTGPLEGTNNKIKTMKRQAYGFRDQEFFELKILDIHQTKYALVG